MRSWLWLVLIVVGVSLCVWSATSGVRLRLRVMGLTKEREVCMKITFDVAEWFFLNCACFIFLSVVIVGLWVPDVSDTAFGSAAGWVLAVAFTI